MGNDRDQLAVEVLRSLTTQPKDALRRRLLEALPIPHDAALFWSADQAAKVLHTWLHGSLLTSSHCMLVGSPSPFRLALVRQIGSNSSGSMPRSFEPWWRTLRLKKHSRPWPWRTVTVFESSSAASTRLPSCPSCR